MVGISEVIANCFFKSLLGNIIWQGVEHFTTVLLLQLFLFFYIYGAIVPFFSSSSCQICSTLLALLFYNCFFFFLFFLSSFHISRLLHTIVIMSRVCILHKNMMLMLLGLEKEMSNGSFVAFLIYFFFHSCFTFFSYRFLVAYYWNRVLFSLLFLQKC